MSGQHRRRRQFWPVPRPAAVLLAVDCLIKSVVGILYGIAYGVIGYCIAAFITEAGAAVYWSWAWLLAWVAAGSAALTVWVVRLTGAWATPAGRTGGAR